MTITQVLETVTGKQILCGGNKKPDSTLFGEKNFEDIYQELHNCGYQKYGYERLIHGATGEMMNAMIFMGPTYYQKLKHMVKDKLHCLTAEHDVLTEEGWKPISEVTLQDKVATLQNGTDLVYENPIQTFHYPDYKGKMYHISNQDIDLDVTIDHRMYVSYDNKNYFLTEARNIVGKSIYYKNIQYSIYVDKRKLRSEHVYEYEGSVYCLQVSSEVFMVRKNGKAVWTGNSRARGPIQKLTRQPLEGRSKEGGLRVGEMEANCLVAHGMAGLIREKLFTLSDYFTAHFCKDCGLFAIANIKKNKYICRNCNTQNIEKVQLPYVMKLLMNELAAMGIASKVGF